MSNYVIEHSCGMYAETMFGNSVALAGYEM